MDQSLETIYANRFAGAESDRDRVWSVLSRDFFQRWVTPTDAVLDVGAGYCEFINHIQADRRWALDLNAATEQKAAPGVGVLAQDVPAAWKLSTASVDVV